MEHNVGAVESDGAGSLGLIFAMRQLPRMMMKLAFEANENLSERFSLLPGARVCDPQQRGLLTAAVALTAPSGRQFPQAGGLSAISRWLSEA
jgi:hypothetical protein